MNILSRDSSLGCSGECRKIIREGEIRRQKEINSSTVRSEDHYPKVDWAFDRSEALGFLGGHL